MTNIPTELLRTLIAVVDFRSFTRAAHSLGITQPAVSAQIKRLQSLLGNDLIDKRSPGFSLTPAGELVVNYARRLLSINDQILDLAAPRGPTKPIRIGLTADFLAAGIALGLTAYRVQRPDLRFTLYGASLEALTKDMREGTTDAVVWTSATLPSGGSAHSWSEQLVWVHSASTKITPNQPVPLVGYGEHCALTQSASAALRDHNLSHEPMYVGTSIAGLAAAVAAGFGVMVLPRSRATIPGLMIWEQPPLPMLPDVVCGVDFRPGAGVEDREQVADAIAAALRPAVRGQAARHGVTSAAVGAAIGHN